jgi:hypothetical protein
MTRDNLVDVVPFCGGLLVGNLAARLQGWRSVLLLALCAFVYGWALSFLRSQSGRKGP